ncbi:MAG: glycosyltransferase family 1 protein [Pseudoxanthomonas sp.]
MTLRVVHFMRQPGAQTFSIERVHEDVRAAMPADCKVETWTCRRPSTGLWPRLRDAWAARRAQADVNHVTGDAHYLAWFLDRKRLVLTVHDLVSLERLKGIKRWVFWLLWYWLPVRRSRVVVTISEATRQALLESVRCDPEKVVVIHNPVSAEFQPAPKAFDAACPRILQIGTGPNKNLDRVAQALQGIPCKLVVIGVMTAEQVETLARHGVECENHFDLPRDALLDEYRRADLLLFASTYEGFGLPIVEANAVGRPVVTSRLPPMPEVAGDAACLVDPFDVASIRGGVLRVIGEPNYRDQLVQRGYANAMRFHASTVASRYAQTYRAIVNSSD